MSKTKGNIRYRKTTSLVTDIVWEIDDALTLLEKDCVLSSCKFSFRSYDWKLELQCVNTYWGRKLFHVLSRKGLALDDNKGTMQWKAGILHSNESEYEIENGEICLNKNCPKWIHVKSWVGRSYDFLLLQKELLVPEGRLSIFLRLSVDLSTELTKAHGCEMTKTVGSIRNRESTSLVTDIVWEIDDALTLLEQDYILQSSTFSFRLHNWKLELQCIETSCGRKTFHVLSRKGSARDSCEGIIKWKAGILNSDGSECETAKGEICLDKYCLMWDIATVWIGHDFKFLMLDSKRLLPEGRLSFYLRLSVHLLLDHKEPRGALQTDFDYRSGDALERNAENRDDPRISEENVSEEKCRNCHVQQEVPNSGSFSDGNVPHEVADTGNSACGNERPSLRQEAEPHNVADSGNSDHENERTSRKNKGTAKVLEDISDLWWTRNNSDMVVEVRGVPFRAHRAILSTRIPMLVSEFQNDSLEITNGVLRIQDCEPEAFGELLHYVYNGVALCLTPTNVFSVYTLAYKYRIEDLKEMCMKFVQDTLCVDSFVDAALLALTYNDGELLQSVISFFTDNIRLILPRMDWQIFVEDHSTWANELLIKSQGLP